MYRKFGFVEVPMRNSGYMDYYNENLHHGAEGKLYDKVGSFGSRKRKLKRDLGHLSETKK